MIKQAWNSGTRWENKHSHLAEAPVPALVAFVGRRQGVDVGPVVVEPWEAPGAVLHGAERAVQRPHPHPIPFSSPRSASGGLQGFKLESLNGLLSVDVKKLEDVNDICLGPFFLVPDFKKRTYFQDQPSAMCGN